MCRLVAAARRRRHQPSERLVEFEAVIFLVPRDQDYRGVEEATNLPGVAQCRIPGSDDAVADVAGEDDEIDLADER